MVREMREEKTMDKVDEVIEGKCDEKVEKDIMDTIDSAIDRSIKKLRDATSGNEIRTFITEYEELMFKRTSEITKQFLKKSK